MNKRNYIVAYTKTKHFPYSQMFSSLNICGTNSAFVQFMPNPHQDYIMNKIFEKFSFIPTLYSIIRKLWRVYFQKKLLKTINRTIKMLYNNNDEIVLIINQAFIINVIPRLKNFYPQIKVVYYFTDQINKCKIRTDIWKNPRKYYADMIISYDENDANRHNVLYYPNPYSEITDNKILKLCNKEKYDVCFIGAMKDRHKDIIAAYDYFVSLGLKVFFYVTHEKHKNFNKHNGIIYNYRSITYNQYLKFFAQSRCILDITQRKSKAYTTRIAESVMLEKKLITNNLNVKSLPFYDKNKMYVYNDFLHIDKGFFKINRKVIYEKKAKDYFSPYKFIEFIDKNL